MAARLLSIDYDPVFGDEDVTRTSFDSDTSLFDYDVVIWDPAASFAKYTRYAGDYQGLPSLSDSTSAQLRSDIKRRAEEVVGFLTSGRTLVVQLCGPQECYVATGEVQYSGTGRNARKTRVVSKLDFLAELPLGLGSVTRARGDRIEVVGEDSIARLLRTHLSSLVYTAFVAEPNATVVARVRGSDHAVALRQKTNGGGNVIAIPRTTFEPDVPEDDEDEHYDEVWPQAAVDFQTGLLAAIAELSGSGEIARPFWSKDYTTQRLRDAQDKVAKQRASVERARARLSKLQQAEEAERSFEQLYLGSGRQLELRVRDVLELLGGEVEEPEAGRADWRVTLDGQRAVLEVKGLTKSAAEKNAAQLEKWVAEELEQSGASPKGILVANTWRETPLADRTKDDFPAQMLPYSTARGHCLVTGLELFAIACEVGENPSRAAHWRKSLLTTSGRLSGVSDWRTYLIEDAPEDASESP